MIRGMYSAVSGIRQHQVMLDVISNNLANVNTVGYKGARATFQDQLQQTLGGGAASGPATAGLNPSQIGLGVRLGSIDSLMGGGSLAATGNTLDVAIQGEGWLRVGKGVPPAVPTEFEYTRAGNLQRNDQGFLTTADGFYVLGGTDAAPTYIQIPAGASSVAIGTDGDVTYAPSGGGARASAGAITLAKFPNEQGLARVSGNRWAETPASGAVTVGPPGGDYGQTISGTLEMSNVDLATEFTQMILAQRGFQANSRVVSVADEMMQDLVNLKR